MDWKPWKVVEKVTEGHEISKASKSTNPVYIELYVVKHINFSFIYYT